MYSDWTGLVITNMLIHTIFYTVLKDSWRKSNSTFFFLNQWLKMSNCLWSTCRFIFCQSHIEFLSSLQLLKKTKYSIYLQKKPQALLANDSYNKPIIKIVNLLLSSIDQSTDIVQSSDGNICNIISKITKSSRVLSVLLLSHIKWG